MGTDEIFSAKKGKRCAIYIRVSSERQVQGFSLEGQKRYLKEWAEFEGMTVVDIYIEPGKSGKSISGREVFQKLLNDVAEGVINIDYVAVFKLSRFGRNAKDVLNSLSYLQRYGVNLICKEDGLDSSTAMGRMMITILGAVAEMERENIITQTMLGREEKAKQGGWNGGFAPYGYELINGKLEPKPGEAEIVNLIFDKFVNSGMGYSTIAGYLNSQGVPRKPSKNSQGRKFTDWNTNQVKRILDNPLYMGKIAFGRRRQEKVNGTENEYRIVKQDSYILSDEISHEALVSEELFENAQIKRTENSAKGRPNVGRGRKYLLSGILKCPMCGSSMHSEVRTWNNKNGKVTKVYYQCSHYAKSINGQCKKNSISAEWVETEVIEYTKLLIRNPIFAEDIQKRIGQKVDLSEVEAELKNYQTFLVKLERSKANLEKDIDNILGDDKNSERKRADMNNRLDKIYNEIYNIEDRITECELKKASIKQDALTIDSVYKMLLVFDKVFDKMDEADKRKLIQNIISEVQLHPKETWSEGKNPVKSIKYAFPVGKEVMEYMRENVLSLETVVLVTRV